MREIACQFKLIDLAFIGQISKPMASAPVFDFENGCENDEALNGRS
jgi:hypothetical protein